MRCMHGGMADGAGTPFHYCLKRRPYSLSASSVLRDGDLKTGSTPEPVFGKAITSLIDFEPHRIDTSLSKPNTGLQHCPRGTEPNTNPARCRRVEAHQT